jgi:hypothetical protein
LLHPLSIPLFDPSRPYANLPPMAP